MIILRISDDTPGFRETFYKGPFETRERAEEMAAKFNDAHKHNNWYALVAEAEVMPNQQDWEKKIYAEYDA